MFARVVRDLENVQWDPIDAGFTQGVKSGDIRTSVVNPLEDFGQFGIVMMFKFNGCGGQRGHQGQR